jgi:hypothetical protein
MFSLLRIDDIIKNRLDIDIRNTIDMDILKKQFMKTTIMFAFILISSLFIYFASVDPNVLTKNTFMWLLLILAPFAFGIYSSTTIIGSGDTGNAMKLFYGGIGLLILSIVGYLYSNASSTELVIFNYIAAVIILFIIIGGLSIIYNIFSNYLQKQSGTTGYIINLIFYIPCLYADFVEYLKQELQITPPVVFILFVLEILLCLVFLFLPKLLHIILHKISKPLMNEPVYLDKEYVVATSETFKMQLPFYSYFKNGDLLSLISQKYPGSNPLKEQNPLDYSHIGSGIKDDGTTYRNDDGTTYRNNNYAVSFWAYVNYGNKSDNAYNGSTTIFNYAGGNGVAGKPSLTYVNDSKTNTNKFVAYFTNNPNATKNSYEFTGVLQRWNYYVFNYIGNRVDFFVNGNLETTFYFDDKNMPLPGSASDTIKVGTDGGIKGAICNVNYYKEPLTKPDIANIYNIMHYKNPPTVSI